MTRCRALLAALELDRTTYPALAHEAAAYEPSAEDGRPRSYPGYPRTALPRVRARVFGSLDRALAARRSERAVSRALPAARALARLLRSGHGALDGRGPAPSAGGLQAIELYVVALADGWLPAGAHHYDRAGSHPSASATT